MRLVFTSFMVFAITFGFAQNKNFQIKQDGFFQDWNAFPGFEDPPGDGEELDILSYSLAYDFDNIYIYVKTKEPFDLFDKSFLKIYLDLDGTSNTGFTINQIGAELLLDFSTKKVTLFQENTTQEISMSKFNIIALPTYTSNQFEISIPILTDQNLGKLIKSNTIFTQIIWDTPFSDFAPNQGEYIPHDISNIPWPTLTDTLMNKGNNVYRLLHYNVLHDGLINGQRSSYFKKVLIATQPDIISFNECWNTTESEAINFINQCFPQQKWVAKKIKGNITCTKFEVENWFEISKGERLLGSLIKTKTPEKPPIFHVNAHLSCCAKDQNRKNQINKLNFYLDSLFQANIISSQTPIIISGDMNLVGYKEQYDLLLKSADFFGHNVVNNSFSEEEMNQLKITDAIPFSLNTNSSVTWRDPKSSYPPGRLDYVFYSNQNIKVTQKVIFDTETMLPKDLNKYNLKLQTTSQASDHLPLVIDFMFY